MVNIDKIFDLFNNYSGSTSEDNIDIYSNSLFKSNIFTQLVLKGENKINFPFRNKDTIDFLIYTRAYEILEEINLESSHKVLKEINSDSFKIALNKAMDYFISTEEYEKCILLKEFLNIFKDNLEFKE